MQIDDASPSPPAFRCRFAKGDPIPDFIAPSNRSAREEMNLFAGRFVVLAFFGSASDAAGRALLDLVTIECARFDADDLVFVGVGNDPRDRNLEQLPEPSRGRVYLWDIQRKLASAFGLHGASGSDAFGPGLLVLDPLLRVLAVIAGHPPQQAARQLRDALDALPMRAPCGGAPVLQLPNLFDGAFCAQLMQAYERHGGDESGIMETVDGKTVRVLDPAYKRRRDCRIEDEQTQARIRHLISRRLAPEIRKAFQFEVSRIERYLVACYDSATGGHFQPHRDNTTRGTAHRRFAVTVNLNDAFDGGELVFPEFGPQRYRPAPGGAVVFSCSLLHTARPVTAGRRFAFLPFLYDEAAAKVREQNNPFLGADVEPYVANPTVPA